MRRIVSILLVSALLLIGSASLTGCVVVPPRGYYPARVWVPGYWGPTHVWVGGYWRNH
jgi:hypothetical protein